MNLGVIGSEEFVLGFRLAGVKRCFEGKAEQAEEMLARAMRDESTGVILVEETFFEQLSQRMREELRERISPVVLEIGLGESELRAKVRRAVGVDLYGTV